MASIFSNRILLLQFFLLSLVLINNVLTDASFTKDTNQKDSIYLDPENLQLPFQSNPNPSEESLLTVSASKIQQRNVIMPRICYYARVSGTAVYQKLCLPYTDK